MGVQMIMRVVLVMSITVLAVGCAAQDGRGQRARLAPIPERAFSSVRGERADIGPARTENVRPTAVIQK
jgi:hypothetical protein